MRRTQNIERRGVFLIAALVCLMISTSLAVSAIRSAVITQRSLRMQQQILQTEFLTRAALNRAIMKLNESPEYRGETWKPTAVRDKWPLAEAEITVQQSNDSNQLEVRVTARLAATTNQPSALTQRSREFTFTNPASPNLESSEDAISE